MTPEAASYLAKARQCLSNARISLTHNLNNDAGRGAYLAAFHTSQAYIFEITKKAAKTHQEVQSEMHRLALQEPRIDKTFPPFLTQAYNLKAVADYETGADSDIPPERALRALDIAERFLKCIGDILASA